MHTQFWPGNLKGRALLEDLERGRRILKWILQKQSVREWTEFSLVHGPMVSSYEY
jgi:hypothetical protein